mmetsp:Transcript_19569/g.61538  ORF Transcript_19569/g.61538 Transcript_19569/m.61538 type:complete len:155 (-) Transcript_19569:1332-1796(-)
MGEESWDAIPSIDCVDEHLQDSFDFYSVKLDGVGRRVRREDLSKLVWSVTRVAVSQARCNDIVEILKEAEGTEMQHLTISQCERIIREIEMQECDKFLEAAELYLKKTTDAEAEASKEKSHRQAGRACCCCAVPCLAPEAPEPLDKRQPKPVKA